MKTTTLHIETTPYDWQSSTARTRYMDETGQRRFAKTARSPTEFIATDETRIEHR